MELIKHLNDNSQTREVVNDSLIDEDELEKELQYPFLNTKGIMNKYERIDMLLTIIYRMLNDEDEINDESLITIDSDEYNNLLHAVKEWVKNYKNSK